MPFVVLPALGADVPAVYDAYFAAFKGEAMGELMLSVLFPDGITEEFRKAHTTATLSWMQQTTNQYTFKVVDTENGGVVGMTLGDLYMLPRSAEERKWPGVTWLEGKHREKAEAVLYPLWEARERIFGGAPYICKCPFCLPLLVDC